MTRENVLAECARIAAGVGAGGGAGGGSAALASVARRRGSLPMSATAKMLVILGGAGAGGGGGGRAGARMGTVGGGCLEAEITERALEVAARHQPEVSTHTLNSEMAGDYGLTCGGTVHMFIEPVYADPALAQIWAAAAVLSAGDGAGVMATSSDWSGGPAKLLVAPGIHVGHAGNDDSLERAVSAHDILSETPLLDNGLMVESVRGPPRLLVFGGGHVGARVGEAAAFAGWRVTVVDDRAEFADASRLRFAERTVVADFGQLPDTLGIDAATYVVIATRGHQHDALVAEQVARGETRYLGMLGSRRKVALTWRLLATQGVPRERLEAIHAPVGLAIGADTPEEIAVSVVAEMITVRRSGSRRRGGAKQTLTPGY
ncbi:MAG: XdhC family protein [Gemmatimonadaceae bacterium]